MILHGYDEASAELFRVHHGSVACWALHRSTGTRLSSVQGGQALTAVTLVQQGAIHLCGAWAAVLQRDEAIGQVVAG